MATTPMRCNVFLLERGMYKHYLHPIYPNELEEEFGDTKVVIRIRKSKKDRQRSGQKKKDKRTNNDQQNIHIKLKIE